MNCARTEHLRMYEICQYHICFFFLYSFYFGFAKLNAMWWISPLGYTENIEFILLSVLFYSTMLPVWRLSIYFALLFHFAHKANSNKWRSISLIMYNKIRKQRSTVYIKLVSIHFSNSGDYMEKCTGKSICNTRHGPYHHLWGGCRSISNNWLAPQLWNGELINLDFFFLHIFHHLFISYYYYSYFILHKTSEA